MPTFAPSSIWRDLDVQNRARPYTQNSSSQNVAVGCSRRPFEQLISATNHLCALHPRTLYTQSWPYAYSYNVATSADPFLQWRYYDYGPNNRTLRYGAIVRHQGLFGGYLWRQGYPDAYRTPNAVGLISPYRWAYFEFDATRGIPTLDALTDGISSEITASGGDTPEFYIWSVRVQEIPQRILYSPTDTCIVPGKISQNHAVIRTNELDEIIRTAHIVRTRNLPVLMSWSAQTETEIGATQGSLAIGITITSTTAINVFDLISITRTATTPGQMVYAYRGAVGNETNNKNIKVRCAVKARVIDGGGSVSGTIRFIGPTHVGSNQCDITVTNTSFQWLGGGANDFIYLNADSDYDDTSTALNKIDVHGLVSSSDTLQIVGLVAWIVYS